MHDVLLPAAHRLAPDVDEPCVAQPLRQPLDPVELQHAAPQIPVEPAGAGAQAAHRDDDRPADEGPDPPAARGVAHRVVVHGERRARLEEVVERAQRDVRRGQVAQQVRGEDAVERAGHPRCREVHRVAVHEGHGLRPLLGPRGVQHLGRRVDGDDLGLGGDLEQRGRGRARAAAEVEQAQPRGRRPAAPCAGRRAGDGRGSRDWRRPGGRSSRRGRRMHGARNGCRSGRSQRRSRARILPHRRCDGTQAAPTHDRMSRDADVTHRREGLTAAGCPPPPVPSPAWRAARGPSRRCAAGTARRSGRRPSGSRR